MEDDDEDMDLEAEADDIHFDFGGFVENDPDVYDDEPDTGDIDIDPYETEHFNLGLNNVTYIEPADAQENRDRFYKWLLDMLLTLTGITMASNFFNQSRESWPFAISMAQFIGSVVRVNTEKVAKILFNAFSPQAQEVLGRLNLSIEDLLSISTQASVDQLRSRWGIYISIIRLDPVINVSDYLWGLYVRSGTARTENQGLWKRLMQYFAFKVNGTRAKSCRRHLDQALSPNAVQHIRVLALFMPDQPKLLCLLLEAVLMFYLDAVQHAPPGSEGNARGFINQAIRKLVAEHAISRPWLGLNSVSGLKQGTQFAWGEIKGKFCILCNGALDNGSRLACYVTDTSLVRVHKGCKAKEKVHAIRANPTDFENPSGKCEPCLALQLRCDHGKPCSTCAKKGYRCWYPHAGEQKPPAKRDSRKTPVPECQMLRREFRRVYVQLLKDVKAFLNPLNKCFWCFVLQLDCDGDGANPCTPCSDSTGLKSKIGDLTRTCRYHSTEGLPAKPKGFRNYVPDLVGNCKAILRALFYWQVKMYTCGSCGFEDKCNPCRSCKKNAPRWEADIKSYENLHDDSGDWRSVDDNKEKERIIQAVYDWRLSQADVKDSTSTMKTVRKRYFIALASTGCQKALDWVKRTRRSEVASAKKQREKKEQKKANEGKRKKHGI